MGNLAIIIYSLIYISIVIGIATLVSRKDKGSSETSRKIVHILLGNWVFFTLFFTKLWAIVLIPFIFIIVNSLSLKYKLISAIERDDKSLGTVYYAVSLFVLSAAGFILGWRTLPFIGILIMAYGDGFAAVVGQKWGRIHPFKFASNKTLAGSLTVGVAAFIVTIISLLVFQGTGTLKTVSIPIAVFIALLTSIISIFIEATGENGCDNLSLPIGSGLFATLLLQFNSPGLFVYMIASLTILIIAYKLKSITPDGMVAAFFTSITLYALGGVWISTSLLVFFILGSIVSKLKNERKVRAELLQEDSGARNWKQVLANSVPACIIVWLAYIYPEKQLILFPAFAVFAAAAADTFSSEIGMMSKGKVFNILTGKPISSGLSGGVTWLGLGAGLLGSILLSLFALPQFGWIGVFYISILGFIGTILDSVIGIALQRKYIGLDGQLQDKATSPYEKPIKGLKIITNNAVNFITLSLVTLSGHIFRFLMIK